MPPVYTESFLLCTDFISTNTGCTAAQCRGRFQMKIFLKQQAIIEEVLSWEIGFPAEG